MTADLTPEEQDFRALLEAPRQYAVWATEVRAAWEATPTGKAHVARQSRDCPWLFRVPFDGRRAA